MVAIRLKSFEFRREREPAWAELEKLLERVEKEGLASLSSTELRRLPMLYRGALSALSVARAISLDRNVSDYLESLCARAYFSVYGAKRTLGETLRQFLDDGFPRAVRELRRNVALSALVLLLGVLTGFVRTAQDDERFYSYVSEDSAQGRSPASSTSELRHVLYSDDESAADMLTAFATFLFTHNARIGMLAFALGFAAGVPTVFLLFQNGLLLGAFAALYQGRGLGADFWGWVLPHGITELGAVILCGGAGLSLGQAILFPGRHGRLANLAIAGRRATLVVLGAVMMLFLAGLIEGVFRQSVHDGFIRYGVAVVTGLVWYLYFTRRPVERIS